MSTGIWQLELNKLLTLIKLFLPPPFSFLTDDHLERFPPIMKSEKKEIHLILPSLLHAEVKESY